MMMRLTKRMKMLSSLRTIRVFNRYHLESILRDSHHQLHNQESDLIEAYSLRQTGQTLRLVGSSLALKVQSSSSKQASYHPNLYLHSKSNASLYSNEDIDYMINMVRLNESTLIQKQWTSTTLKQMINKVLLTIRTQCEELQLDKLSEKIYFHYHKVTTENLIKLFFRCKEFFVIRLRAIRLLKLIEGRE